MTGVVFVDGQKTIETLVKGMRKFFKDAGKRNAVVGISGGVDSATVCALLCKALGPKKVFAYHLPAGDVSHLADAAAVAEKFGCNFEIADISGALEAMSKTASPKDQIGKGNMASRLRMVFLYAKARDLGAVVAGTSNKSEIMLGYFTKFGDGGVDFEPIGDLFKAQVYALARQLGVPKSVIDKPPTAGLWPGQTDESELGAPYAQIDRVLAAIAEGAGTKTREQPRAKAYSERGSEIYVEPAGSTIRKECPCDCAENPRNRGFIVGITETPRVAPSNFGSLLARLKSRGFSDPRLFIEKKFGKKTVQLIMQRMAKNRHKLELPESISLK